MDDLDDEVGKPAEDPILSKLTDMEIGCRTAKAITMTMIGAAMLVVSRLRR